MRTPKFCSKYSYAALFFIYLAFCPPVEGQGGSATGVLTQLATAFEGQQTVSQVQITGTATWTAGSLSDSGTVSMTASADGGSQTQLTLATSGVRTETVTGSGLAAHCQWAGANGVAHTISFNNCWRPALWFLPAFSLQPSSIPSYLGVTDLGTGTVGFGEGTYRHLRASLSTVSLPNLPSTMSTSQFTADLGLDPTTMLPAVFAYSIMPDNGPTNPVSIEIHYSNYQTANGVEIPFLIQRYVNGSLQVSIVVTSAQLS